MQRSSPCSSDSPKAVRIYQGPHLLFHLLQSILAPWGSLPHLGSDDSSKFIAPITPLSSDREAHPDDLSSLLGLGRPNGPGGMLNKVETLFLNPRPPACKAGDLPLIYRPIPEAGPFIEK